LAAARLSLRLRRVIGSRCSRHWLALLASLARVARVIGSRCSRHFVRFANVILFASRTSFCSLREHHWPLRGCHCACGASLARVARVIGSRCSRHFVRFANVIGRCAAVIAPAARHWLALLASFCSLRERHWLLRGCHCACGASLAAARLSLALRAVKCACGASFGFAGPQ